MALMGWDAWFTLAVLMLALGSLIFTRVAPDVALVGAVAILLLAGIIDPEQALAGLSNEGMVTVGVLFVVGAGVRETGGVDFIAQRLFGRPKIGHVGHRPHDGAGHGAQRVHEQHAAGGDADSGGRRLGQAAPDRGLEADDPAELRGHPRRHLHADRHQHQPGRQRAC